MNENIKELLLKSGLQTDSDEDENLEYRIKEELKFITDGHGIDIEQFSQMLIKECIKVVQAVKTGACADFPPDVALDIASKHLDAYFELDSEKNLTEELLTYGQKLGLNSEYLDLSKKYQK